MDSGVQALSLPYNSSVDNTSYMLYRFISSQALISLSRHPFHRLIPGKLWCSFFLYLVHNLSVKYSNLLEVNLAILLAILYVSRCLYGLGGFIPFMMNRAFTTRLSKLWPFCVITISA